MEKLKEIFKIINDNLAVILLLGGGIIQITKFLITTHFERKRIFYNENMMIEIEGLKNFKELYYACVAESEKVYWEMNMITKENWDQLNEFDNYVENLRAKYVGLSVNMKKIHTLLNEGMHSHLNTIEVHYLNLIQVSNSFAQYAHQFWDGGDMSDPSLGLHGIIDEEKVDLKSFGLTKLAFLQVYSDSQNQIFDSGSKLFIKLNKKSKSWF